MKASQHWGAFLLLPPLSKYLSTPSTLSAEYPECWVP